MRVPFSSKFALMGDRCKIREVWKVLRGIQRAGRSFIKDTDSPSWLLLDGRVPSMFLWEVSRPTIMGTWCGQGLSRDRPLCSPSPATCPSAFIMDGHVCLLLWNVGSLWAEPLLSVIVEPCFPAPYLCNCKHLIHADVIKLTNRTFLSSAVFHPEDG